MGVGLRKMKLLFIRHGMTQGNYFKRYIGSTDEPLCKEGFIQMMKIESKMKASDDTKEFMKPDLLFVSPMFRCIQTAQILFPGTERIIIPEFREMDFGKFENRAYENDLQYLFEYRVWIKGGCEGPVPGGESKQEFTARCLGGFEKAKEIMAEASGAGADLTGNMDDESSPEPASGKPGRDSEQTAVFVVHGGTIMSILSVYGQPPENYYSWYVKNGHGFTGEWDGSHITDIKEI